MPDSASAASDPSTNNSPASSATPASDELGINVAAANTDVASPPVLTSPTSTDVLPSHNPVHRPGAADEELEVDHPLLSTIEGSTSQSTFVGPSRLLLLCVCLLALVLVVVGVGLYGRQGHSWLMAGTADRMNETDVRRVALGESVLHETAARFVLSETAPPWWEERFARRCEQGEMFAPQTTDAVQQETDLYNNITRHPINADLLPYLDFPSFAAPPDSDSASECGDGILHIDERTAPYYYFHFHSCIRLTRQLTSSRHRYCPSAADRPVLFHMNWSGDKFHQQAITAIQSFLVTARLGEHMLVIWSDRTWLTTDTDVANQPGSYLLPPELLRLAVHPRFAPHLSFRLWNGTAELERTQAVPAELVDKLANTKDDLHWADGDLLRLVVLYNYGGVYVDADAILLRDLSPLLGGEWLYKWGTECGGINGALARFHRNSSVVRHMLGTLAQIGPGMTNWGAVVYQETDKVYRERNETAFTILPTCFVDPPWLGGQHRALMEKGRAEPSMWNGPFASHIHGHVWETALTTDETSGYGVVRSRIERRIDEMMAE